MPVCVSGLFVNLVMEGKHWGELIEDEDNFTSPYLLNFDEIEKLNQQFVWPSPNKNTKSDNAIVTQM